MFGLRLIKQLKLPRARQLNCTSVKRNKPVSNDPLPKSNAPQEVDNSMMGKTNCIHIIETN